VGIHPLHFPSNPLLLDFWGVVFLAFFFFPCVYFVLCLCAVD
jgi:hypothetical protein